MVASSGMVIRDNLSRLRPGTPAPALGGERATVIDRTTGETVGYAYVDVEREFLATELHGFLRAMLGSTALGGVVIAVVALSLAAWIARRITAPVTLLTTAAKRIARGGESELLPVMSEDELGQMSEAFNRMTNALQAQREVRRRLVNDLSHELNTPLAVIRLEAQGLRDGLQAPGEAAELIIGEVTLLANLVRDLNWLAETDSGDLRLSREAIAVGQLLDSELHRWQSQARMGQIDLELAAAPRLPVLELDWLRMSQALGNVVQNALQHTAGRRADHDCRGRGRRRGGDCGDGRRRGDCGGGSATRVRPAVSDGRVAHARDGRLGVGAVDRTGDRCRARRDDRGGKRRTGERNDGTDHAPGRDRGRADPLHTARGPLDGRCRLNLLRGGVQPGEQVVGQWGHRSATTQRSQAGRRALQQRRPW